MKPPSIETIRNLLGNVNGYRLVSVISLLLAAFLVIAQAAPSSAVPIKVEICQYQPNPTWWSKCDPGPFSLAGPPRELVMTRVFVAAPTVITITFHRLDGTTLFTYTTDQRAATGWSWAHAHVGVYSWEIVEKGTYTVTVTAASGTTTMSFEVR